MPQLILIKHAAPLKDANKPSNLWRLSDAGREQAAALAERLRGRPIDIIVTSAEAKAEETGRIVGEELDVPVESAEGLQEHDRSNVPMLATREFISTMALFFKERNRLVLGKETAADAKRRIEQAVEQVVAAYPARNVAIVTHGTVLALFAATYLREDAFSIWRRMGLPSFIALDWAEAARVLDFVEKV